MSNRLDDFMESPHPRWHLIAAWLVAILPMAGFITEASLNDTLRKENEAASRVRMDLSSAIEQERENSRLACWRLASTVRVMEHEVEPKVVTSAGAILVWSQKDKHWVFFGLAPELAWEWR